MSAIGTKRTFPVDAPMSAFGGKADMVWNPVCTENSIPQKMGLTCVVCPTRTVLPGDPESGR